MVNESRWRYRTEGSSEVRRSDTMLFSFRKERKAVGDGDGDGGMNDGVNGLDSIDRGKSERVSLWFLCNERSAAFVPSNYDTSQAELVDDVLSLD